MQLNTANFGGYKNHYMNWEEYLQYFEGILSSDNLVAPYDNDDYFQYTKLNWARSNRWLKKSPLTQETKNIIESINEIQEWVVITEPWCGDAAHTVPVIYLMSQLNTNIHFTIQLRDSGSEIENYLTNGTKSIPILIVRDQNGKDLFHWGPRPKEAQVIFQELKTKNSSFEEAKVVLQNYYNKDKAISTQDELIALFKSLKSS